MDGETDLSSDLTAEIVESTIKELLVSAVHVASLCKPTLYFACLPGSSSEISKKILRKLLQHFEKLPKTQLHIFLYEDQLADLSTLSSLFSIPEKSPIFTYSICTKGFTHNITPKESLHLLFLAFDLPCFFVSPHGLNYIEELRELLINRYFELVPGGRLMMLIHYFDANCFQSAVIKAGEALVRNEKITKEEFEGFLTRENRRGLNDCYDALSSVAQYFYVVNLERKTVHSENNKINLNHWVKSFAEPGFLASLSRETDQPAAISFLLSELNSQISENIAKYSYLEITLEKL